MIMKPRAEATFSEHNHWKTAGTSNRMYVQCLGLRPMMRVLSIAVKILNFIIPSKENKKERL